MCSENRIKSIILKTSCVFRGIVLKKLHHVVRFNQECLLKPYIEKNSKLYQAAESSFEKDYYELMMIVSMERLYKTIVITKMLNFL